VVVVEEEARVNVAWSAGTRRQELEGQEAPHPPEVLGCPSGLGLGRRRRAAPSGAAPGFSAYFARKASCRSGSMYI
jgi:hypothetical protein